MIKTDVFTNVASNDDDFLDELNFYLKDHNCIDIDGEICTMVQNIVVVHLTVVFVIQMYRPRDSVVSIESCDLFTHRGLIRQSYQYLHQLNTPHCGLVANGLHVQHAHQIIF